MSRAFTLVEMMLVVAIISTLGIMTSAFYARFLTQSAVDNTTDQIIADMEKAQLYAMESKQGTAWGVTFVSSKIVLFSGNSYAARDTRFDESYAVGGKVMVTGLAEVVFSRIKGLPSTTPTITISGNNTIKTVTVNAQGIASR